MKKIIILGSGQIGSTVAFMLQQSKKYVVSIADIKKNEALKELENLGVKIHLGDFTDVAFLTNLLEFQDYVLNACPFHFNISIINCALKTNTHYFDLSEDVASTEYIQSIASKAPNTFIPQCGLAPGFISITANHLCTQFDKLKNVKLRVGALTLNPNNYLKYNLSWSTEGLLNEYSHSCNAIVNSQLIKTEALEGLEHFTLDGVEYEAFNTSGGIGGLAEKLNGKVENLDYKTIRYKGHRDLMKFLFEDLGFKNNRETLRDLFNQQIPTTKEDVILIYISVNGWKNGILEQKTQIHKIKHQVVENKFFTGIQLTTAGSACAVIDLHATNQLPQQGFVMQEDIPYEAYSKSAFLQFYYQN